MNKMYVIPALVLLSACAGARAESAQMCVTGVEQTIAMGSDVTVAPSFVLPAGATVMGVVVDVDLDHTWLGDLVIQIEHGGTVITLLDRVNDDVFAFGCGGRDLTASFRDDATVSPADLCLPSTPDPQSEPMLVGDLIPEQALANFNGMDASGRWTITVSDQAGNDNGVLHSVCLTIDYDAAPACAGDVNGSGGVDVDDLNAILSAWGTNVGIGDPRDLANGDGVVDVDDLNVVLGNWGASC